MEKIGYSLINSNNQEIQHWGESNVDRASLPDKIVLPNSNIIHAPNLGPIQNYRLVERWYSYEENEYKVKTGQTVTFDGTKIIVQCQYQDISLESAKTKKIDDLASVRYTKENTGIVYANNIFTTDRDSRVNYVGALTQASANNQYTVRWKAISEETSKSTFVTLSANDIIYIYSYGIDYITKCFDREDELIQIIEEANTLNSLISINLSSDWPNNRY
jgi:hypothetical protein